MPARVRLLVSGDLHVGRYPSRVPPDDSALSVEAIARAVVDQAIERAVDAVLLAGDVADESNKHFEAFGVLERMLHRLADAGVLVFLVTGDHDYDVLGSIVDAVNSPFVRLLGRGQRWETATLDKRGEDALRVVGWSYAGPHVHESPLDDFPNLDDSLPSIALLHGDLERAVSPHAPVSLDAVQATGATAWVLGHGHAPRAEHHGRQLVLVPGTPQPLDASESGPHGAWIVEIGADGDATATALPIATVRYDSVSVDLEGAATATSVRERIAQALRLYAEGVREASPSVRRAVVEVTLKGQTLAYRSVDGIATELVEVGDTQTAGLAVVVERVDDQVRPALDLERLAEGSGPVATLAALALRLAAGTPSPGDLALIRQGVEALHQARRARVFEPLARHGRLDPDLEKEAVVRLRRQTYRLLDEILSQRPSELALPDDAEPSGDGAVALNGTAHE